MAAVAAPVPEAHQTARRSNARAFNSAPAPVNARVARTASVLAGAKWSRYSVMAWYPAHRVPLIAFCVSASRIRYRSVEVRCFALFFATSEAWSVSGHR